MSICCDCGKDKQAFLCLSCNDKWLNQAERRGRVEELKRLEVRGDYALDLYIEKRLLELEKGDLK